MFDTDVAKGHDVIGNHQHLFNCFWTDEIMYKSFQKVQLQCADNVVSEYEVILREVPDA